MEKLGNQLSRYGAISNPLPVAPNAKVFFVASSDSVDYQDLQHEFPVDKDGEVRVFTTIDAAIGACTADRGDVIYVMPGHAETISAAAGIDLDVNGVSIIGLGRGTAKPTITIGTAATADFEIAADDVTIKGLKFVANFADVQTLVEITAGENIRIEDCEFVEAGTNLNFVNAIRTVATANANDGLEIVGCKFIGADAANDEAILIREDIDQLVIKDCYFSLAVADGEACIGFATGKDGTNVLITDNVAYRLNTAGDLFIDNDTTANSGIVARNLVGHADTAGEVLVDMDGVRLFDNKGTAVDTASGYVLPAIDS